jgi:hypothetical protein
LTDYSKMLENLKIYIMDLVDVFVLLLETSFVQTNLKIIEELFWGERALLQNQSEQEQEQE